jgi:hypothetical protein
MPHGIRCSLSHLVCFVCCRQSRTISCSPSGSDWAHPLAKNLKEAGMTGGNRCREHRCCSDASVELSAVTPASDHFLVKTKCQDISPAGLRVLSPETMTPQTVVSIHSYELGLQTVGVVQHCQRVSSGYAVGIRLMISLNP